MSDPTGLHLEVYQFLAERFTGAENATPREKIIAQFKFYRNKNIDDRLFRQVVSDLVMVYKKAICTTPGTKGNPKGYFFARTSAELDAAVNHLRAIGSANFERANALATTDPAERQGRLL